MKPLSILLFSALAMGQGRWTPGTAPFVTVNAEKSKKLSGFIRAIIYGSGRVNGWGRPPGLRGLPWTRIPAVNST